MGLSLFAREKTAKRVELARNVAMAYAALAAVGLAWIWWIGGLPTTHILIGLGYVGMVAGLAVMIRRDDTPATLLGVMVGVVLVSAVAASIRRPLTIDILVWIALILLARGYLAARRLEAASRGMDGSPSRKTKL